METRESCPVPSDDDLRAALRELKGYVDVTEEDLKKIYEIALRYAQERMRSSLAVSDLMTRDVVTVKRETSLEEAARRLSGLRISGMPVVDDHDRVIGVIGELDIMSAMGGKRGAGLRDFLRRILGEPVPARKTGERVEDVMSAPAITIRAAADVREAARVLDDRRIKRLPVVDDDGKLIGIISRADIVRAMSKEAVRREA